MERVLYRSHRPPPLLQCGFKLAFQDTSNTMFVQLHLRKVGEVGEPVWPALKPCIYKRR